MLRSPESHLAVYALSTLLTGYLVWDILQSVPEIPADVTPETMPKLPTEQAVALGLNAATSVTGFIASLVMFDKIVRHRN